jgi:3-oxoacid CoA-transferase
MLKHVAGGIPIRLGGSIDEVVVHGTKKEARDFNGKRHVMETAIAGDVAFVHAWKADAAGNLVFRYAANNFNAAMARNAKLVVVEAEEIVPIGSLDPNEIQCPGIYVDRIVRATEPKQIELLTVQAESTPGVADEQTKSAPGAEIRNRIARRAARELREGMYLNLGVGIPTLVTEHLPPGVNVWLESENGILGMGPFPPKDKVDPCVSCASRAGVFC